MGIYLYECENEECKTKEEEVRQPSQRDDPKECPECGSSMHRIFDPKATQMVMWRHSTGTGLTPSGPTRNSNYTIKDVADEHDWWGQWGIKR